MTRARSVTEGERACQRYPVQLSLLIEPQWLSTMVRMATPRPRRLFLVVSEVVTLCLIALSSVFAACGDERDAVPGSNPDGITVDPLPLGTPGSRDPSHIAPPDEEVRFKRGTLQLGDFTLLNPTTLAFGPDGRLYVGQANGRVVALSLAGRAVTDVEVIAEEDVLQHVLGLAFNPTDPPSPVTLYVSQTNVFAGLDAPAYPGKVSKLVAPAYAPIDMITGLPVSVVEHGTNGLAFDHEGRLYIAQGGNTDAGVPARPGRDETPLSAAILVADVQEPGFDGAIRYEPPNEATSTNVNQVAGDVRVYASGFRNPYDLVLHSNGRIYATDNGPNSRTQLVNCSDGPPQPNAPDELNLVLEGRYYGHPNANRGRFDERQCTYRTPEDTSGESTPPLATLGYSVSADGIVEYASDAFGGRLQGDLIYVEWAKGRVWRVALSDDGTRVESTSRLVPEVLSRPLDVTLGPDGVLYIAEWGAGQISYFVPAS